MGKTNKNRKKLLSASVRVLGSDKFHNKSVWLKNVSKLQQKNDKIKDFNISLTLS